MVQLHRLLWSVAATSLLLLFAIVSPAMGRDAGKVEVLRDQARAAVANGAPGAARDASGRWTLHVSEGGRYAVEFPVPPALSERALRMGTAVLVNRQAKVTILAPLAVLAAEYRDVPPAWEKEGLASALEQASGPDVFAVAGLRVLERKKFSLGPYPGVEVSLEDPAGLLGRARMVVRGGRLHSLSVFWEKGSAGASLADRFLSSFRLSDDLPVSR